MAKNTSKVGFVSLGCPKALVDSERILTQLKIDGYDVVPSYDDADIVVVNTCGFIDSAKQESLDAIGEALNEAFLKIGRESSYYSQLDEAIQAGLRLSKGKNEVSILFSPGFASFDQFNSYSDRGKFFQKTIFSLLKGSGCL